MKPAAHSVPSTCPSPDLPLSPSFTCPSWRTRLVFTMDSLHDLRLTILPWSHSPSLHQGCSTSQRLFSRSQCCLLSLAISPLPPRESCGEQVFPAPGGFPHTHTPPSRTSGFPSRATCRYGQVQPNGTPDEKKGWLPRNRRFTLLLVGCNPENHNGLPRLTAIRPPDFAGKQPYALIVSMQRMSRLSRL